MSKLGVLSAHCPDGLTRGVWRGALSEFTRKKAAGEPMGELLRTARLGLGFGVGLTLTLTRTRTLTLTLTEPEPEP